MINAVTGQSMTEQEREALWPQLKARAIEIFSNPYASPEKLEWAIEVYPEGMGEIFQERGCRDVSR